MRLKSLKLAGFKSFANVTTFSFPRGITAIVGPNGCGKSNVIDAIRWVLGETSAKQLRGGAMSDVIFAGTEGKSAKSVASVELTFEHTQDEQTGIRHALNLYQELSVRRQVNLDGRSDYFINGTRVRRRDVVDVFLGTGLGARSYAVIEQGMIGRIVESSPVQLREFIEEAAGVSRYQARRDETQKKLEKTQDNLARLQDMQSEMTRHQKRLAKQAASAQQHQVLSAQLADIQQQLAIQQLYQAKAAQLQQKAAHDDSAQQVTLLQGHYEQLKAKQDKLTARINQEQWLKDDAQSAHYEQQLHYQKAEQQWQNLQTAHTQTQQQLSDNQQQQRQLATEMAELHSHMTAQQTQLAEQQPKLAELMATRHAQQKTESSIARAYHEAQHELTRLQALRRDLEQQQTINSQAMQRHKHSQDKWRRRQDNWQALWDEWQGATSTDADAGAAQDLAANIETRKQALQQLERQKESVHESLATAEPQVSALQQQLSADQHALSESEKRGASLAGEYDTLHQILHPKPPRSRAASANSAASAQSVGAALTLPITTLREQIELSAQGQAYAPVLDQWLAPWLESHVLNTSWDDKAQSDQAAAQASALITYAKTAQGHSLWLCTDQRQMVDQTDTFINQLPHAIIEKVVPLSSLIAKPTLALWQQCYLYLTDSTEHALDDEHTIHTLRQALSATASLLTTDGWIINRYGSFHINAFIQNNGDDNQSAPSAFLTERLKQRTRLHALEELLTTNDARIDTQRAKIKHTQNSLDAISISLDEARAQMTRLTQEQHRQQQALTQAATDFERWQADSKRLSFDKNELQAERKELEQEQHTLAATNAQTAADIDRLMPQIAAATETYQQRQAERTQWHRARSKDEETIQALQLTIQKTEIQREHSAESLKRATEQHDKLTQSEQTLSARLLTYQDNRPIVQKDLEAAQQARDEQQAILTERDGTLAALKVEHRTQQRQLDAEQTALQDAQQTHAAHATELALSGARLDAAGAHVQALFDAAYVSSLLTDFIAHQRRVRPEKINELQDSAAALERQIQAIGAVNLAAVAELEDVNERLAPLAQQTADIKASMDTLTDAIAAIDDTTKTLFMQTLDAVNSDLSDLFAKVFGGGQASLTLNIDDLPANTPKSEQWRAGLTLMAQPKGKRNSRLAVLSGGEKTLTALSLIFAIFKQHPAPFCVLDEVDAPLDDANVARFTSLITELADDLQFIFISHNKLSMQIADELKGITMPQAGISTLVSVSLDEAARYLDN